jgi:hypothetical protein
MPKIIDGKRVTKKEHEIWKGTKKRTGSGGKATNAVRRYRNRKRKK